MGDSPREWAGNASRNLLKNAGGGGVNTSTELARTVLQQCKADPWLAETLKICLEPAGETAESTPCDTQRVPQRRHSQPTEQVRAAYAKALLDHSISGQKVPSADELAKRYGLEVSAVYKAIGRYKQIADAVASQSMCDKLEEQDPDELATRKRVVGHKRKNSSD